MEFHLKLAVVVITLAISSHNAVAEKVANSRQSSLTGPSGLFPTASSERSRFSRLLHQNAGALQFSSISNAAPPIPGLPKDIKDVKGKNVKKATLSSTHLGRRTLDYDDSENFDEQGHPLPRIITQPQPGEEYVYIRQGGIQTEEQQAAAASVTTSITRQPGNQRSLTLLRQFNGKTVNISPVFSNHDENAKGENPIFQKNDRSVPSEREYELASDDFTTAMNVEDKSSEATTVSNMEMDVVEPQEKRQMIVNVVTSKPRVEFEDQNKTAPTTTTTTTTKSSVDAKSYNIQENSHSADLKENLVVQSSRRIGSFPDFEDSPNKLQTAESSSQPARVNVRPAQSGKEYEYEYIYYYYDDDDEDNSTSKVKADNITKGQGSSRAPTRVSSTPLSVATKVEPDFEDEELEEFDDEAEAPVVIAKPSPAPKSPEPVKQRAPVPEKFSNTNQINQLDRSRSPKAIPSEKAIVPEADYKLEAGDFEQYEDDEQVQVKAKGQPQRPPSVEDTEEDQHEIVSQEPPQKVTSAPVPVSSASGQESMATMAKSHPDSVNSPVILKQSSLLQSVPASQLQPQTDAPTRGTSPLTTPTTTTTTEAVSEADHSVRAPTSRFRGQQQRIRGSSTSEAAKVRQQLVATEQAVSDQPDEVVLKSTSAPHRSFNKDSSRRIPSRRPTVETSQTAPESPAPVPSGQDTQIRNHAVRTRFPPRTSAAPAAPTTTEAVLTSQSSDSPTHEVEETKGEQAKESYVRSKSANDLFTFTRLQQAISSRAPARKDVTGKAGPIPKTIGGFINSNEQSTDAVSSEATTVPAINDAAHSSEQAAPVTQATTTSTTTTEAVQLDKFGKPRNRFGRTRRPLVASGNAGSSASSTTETPVSSPSRVPPQNRNRFSGRRKQTTTSPEEVKQTDDVPSTATTASEAPVRARLPTRNRFATRNRGQASTTEESFGKAHEDEKKEPQASEPSVAPVAPVRRNKPIFQGRRRNPAIGGHNATTAQQEENASSSPVPVVKTTDAQTVSGDENKRPVGGLGNIQRRRPGVGPRIRGGRLGASTTTTTEAAVPVSNGQDAGQEQVVDIEQSPTTQSEQIEQAAPIVTSSVASIVESTNQRGNNGVVGRLRTRTKLVTTTTTAAPEPALRERKPSRLNGILNRRKPGVPLAATTASPAKEESKIEALEEANNNAKEEDSQHKGVVVQVSSSVTESEEQKEHIGEEEAEPSSTTAASILNRLKSQRKPGSIFRKRTDPHGE